MAIDLGARITDLVLLAASIDPAQERTAWYQYAAEWPPVAVFVPAELAVTSREIRALQGELTVMLPLWGRVTQRVTIVQGGRDTLVPPANADFAERVLQHAQPLSVVRLPDGNHFLPWNRYGLVRRTTIEQLDR
jgi:fermentation-respiration switch protein FrsA (DUF1100 family)